MTAETLARIIRGAAAELGHLRTHAGSLELAEQILQVMETEYWEGRTPPEEGRDLIDRS